MKKQVFLLRHSGEEGGAAVEVAILSLVMVPMAIYAIFFFDYAFINLKASEAARYAAWEMTAMQISDWKSHTHLNNDQYLDDRMVKLVDEVRDRWGDDMNGATIPADSLTYSGAGGCFFSVKKTGLAVTELSQENGNSSIEVILSDTSVYVNADSTEKPEDAGDEPSKPSDVGIFQDALNKLSGLVGNAASEVYHWLGFNTKGFIETEFSVKLKFTRTAPIYKGESLFIGSDGLPLLKGREKIVVDAWDLKNGGNADYGRDKGPGDGGAGEEYKNQIKKMVFLGVTGKLSDLLGGAGDFMNAFMDFLNIRNPFEPVVRSFALKHADSADGALEFGDNRVNSFKDAPSKFYTNVFKDTHDKSKSDYYNVYVKQSPSGQNASMKTTGYYMGCDKPEIVDRQDCWQN